MIKAFLSSVIFFLCTTYLLSQTEKGIASFYADKFVGRSTASGERYSHNKMTAAHRTHPFGTRVEVTNKKNGKKVIVRINDRGPFARGRIIDLSKKAAQQLDFINDGLTQVEVKIFNGNSSGGSSSSGSSSSSGEYYSVSVSSKKPKGYGVQISSFNEMVNLLRLMENLQNNYSASASVQVVQVRGKKFYRVILGQFPSQSAASALLRNVKKDYKGAFIKKYD